MKAQKITYAVLLAAVLLMSVFSMASQAVTTGSITINLSHSQTEASLADVSFRLYYVASAKVGDGGINYEWISPYDESNIELGDLQDASLPIHLAFFSQSNDLPFTEKSTDENGVLVFSNLRAGLYLVVFATGEYTSSPFLVSVPNYDSVKKEWDYDVDASPKISDDDVTDVVPDTYISVIKEWQGAMDHPGSVTVVLLRDYKEYKKIQLNELNNWHYRFDDLPKNHVWNVVEMQVPDGYTVSYETSSNTVTIINKSDKADEPTSEGQTKPEEDKLVQTGQLNWPVPVFATLGLLLFGIGWAMLNINRRETE